MNVNLFFNNVWKNILLNIFYFFILSFYTIIAFFLKENCSICSGNLNPSPSRHDKRLNVFRPTFFRFPGDFR